MDDIKKSSLPSKPAGPLAGLRVLDLTQFLSGPFGTMILGDLGAEVIKVEPKTGELSRTIPPHFVGEDSVYYLSVNRNKKNIVVDLKTPEGVQVVRELALACDIVVENFRPGVLKRLGISHDEISALKPAIVWCSISGFGQDGPWRDWPAYDMMIQALSGGMSLTGEPNGPSVRAGIPLGDLAAGMFGVIGILAALQECNRTGKGRVVDVAMLDCQVAMLSYQAAYYLHSGQVPGRQGSGHDSIPTYGSFDAGDGRSLVVTANTEKMWQQMATILNLAKLIDDPRFLTNRERLANRQELEPLLKQAFRARAAQEWMADFLAAGIPAAVVNTLDLALSSPQVAHRDMLIDLENTAGKPPVRVVGNPIKFDGKEVTPTAYPPSLGQDTDLVLESILGLSRAKIDALHVSGAVVQGIRQQAEEAAAAIK
ncbi:MAG TPA: CoA transferase [Herbaspirillum sp.]|jgi:crotonobetainyl-CoA:carnitine CoA-transferase CaiB-like acyl-CoA transferase